MSHSYTDLVAWKKSIELVTDVYRETRCFPKDELYGLTSQIRRAAVSVPSNVAEGQGRLSPGEFRQFLGNAPGSVLELQTQIMIALNLRYLAREAGEQLFGKSQEVLRIINGLLDSVGKARNSKLETRN